MFRSIGWQELLIVLVIVLVLFGPKRLPQLGKTLGKTMRNLREGVEGKLDSAEDDQEVEVGTKSEDKVNSEDKSA
ncbi:MAG TPA: twin-arginine translocase TatA/TatE family subunit [Coriobacteriia bacterium]|nr:twin-arginine translocase TatA/TatE family subunit [Coriobacteriia bacterium]